MYGSVRKKINKEIKELKDVMTQMGLTDIYKAFHPNIKEYTFFSAPQETFSKTDHIPHHKQISTDTN